MLGVTLSTEQLGVANQRAAAGGLSDRCRFELKDYRDLAEPFDRIVSVGMFEHVGVGHYDTFFGKVRRAACAGRRCAPAYDWALGRSGLHQSLASQIYFSGRLFAGLVEVLPAIERSGLYVTDVEILRLHYAETLKEWRLRFAARIGQGGSAL